MSATKICTSCAETIKTESSICRFCRTMQDLPRKTNKTGNYLFRYEKLVLWLCLLLGLAISLNWIRWPDGSTIVPGFAYPAAADFTDKSAAAVVNPVSSKTLSPSKE